MHERLLNPVISFHDRSSACVQVNGCVCSVKKYGFQVTNSAN